MKHAALTFIILKSSTVCWRALSAFGLHDEQVDILVMCNVIFPTYASSIFKNILTLTCGGRRVSSGKRGRKVGRR